MTKTNTPKTPRTTKAQRDKIQWLETQDGCAYVIDAEFKNESFIRVIGDPYDDMCFFIYRDGRDERVY